MLKFLTLGASVFMTFNSTPLSVASIHLSNIFQATERSQKKIDYKDYNYISFSNLYEHGRLYKGSKVYQHGLIDKVILDDEKNYMLVILEGKDSSKSVKVEYNDNTLKKHVDLQAGSKIKIYGKVKKSERYENNHGRQVHRPVIAASCIGAKK